MKKTTVVFLAVMLCAVMSAVALVGCGGSSSSSSAASGSASASSASASAASTSASASASAASTSASASADASRSSSDSLINIDGVDVKDISVDMVGDTPNFMIIFSNTTDKDITIDMTPFKVVNQETGEEINFHFTTKTINANTPYSQNAMTTSANALKAGDKVNISYGDTDLGTFEVTEF